MFYRICSLISFTKMVPRSEYYLALLGAGHYRVAKQKCQRSIH